MELGVAKKDTEKEKPKFKLKIYKFFNNLFRLIFIIIAVAIAVEGILVAKDFLAKQPELRMCSDKSMCISYCASEGQKQCVDITPPEIKQSYDFNKLITGKINILEYLNPDQKFCYCGAIEGENRLETFYDFYSSHN